MRRSRSVLIGFGALLLYGLAGMEAVGTANSVLGVISALLSLIGLAVLAYAWRSWWLGALCAGGVGTWLTISSVHLHPVLVLVLMGYAALIGWWSTLRPTWPLKTWQPFLAVGLLVSVSLGLSALLAMRSIPVDSHLAFVMAVLYLSTPPFEWGVVLTLLAQSHSLPSFVSRNYGCTDKSLRQVATGFLVGVGLVAVTSLIVRMEQEAFGVHVKANNPFVTTPGLSNHHWAAASLIVVGVVILAPLAEEALFRGLLYGTLTQRWRVIVASVVSAGIFGLAHLDLSLLLPLVLAGMVLNALYQQSGSLIPSTVAHATLNAISVFAALGVSGTLR